MSKITTIVAAIARIPVNFISEVAKDIDTLNKQAASKPASVALDDEELQMIEARRARKATGAK